MKKNFFKSFRFVLFFFLFSSCFTNLFAYDATTKTVRIGYIDYNGMIFEKDGVFDGYAVSYLNKLAEYTGWNYQYVYGIWSELLEDLRVGKIDFIVHAQRTAAREKNYIFSKYSVGSETSVLYTGLDNIKYFYNDIEAFDGISVAMMRGSFQNSEFDDYAKLNNFSYKAVLYDSEIDCFKALDQHQVDAVAMGSLAGKVGYKVISRFGSDPFYLMSGKMNKDLMNIADLGHGQLIGDDKSFLNSLFEKYYGKMVATNVLPLTREEFDYIKNAGDIVVGQIRNRFPVSYLDEKTGELKGITEDLLVKISKLSGLNFVSKPIALDVKPLTALKNKDFDLVMGILNMQSFRNDKEIVVSKPYISSTMSVALKKGIDFNPSRNYTVALKNSFQAMQEYIQTNYPQFSTKYYSSDNECLDAIISGEADIVMQNVYVLNYWLQRPKYESLQILPTTFFTEENCIASLKSTNNNLISIINKCIDHIRREDIDEVILANTSAMIFHLSACDILYKFRLPLTIVAILFALCICLFVVIVSIRSRSLFEIEAKNKLLGEKSMELESKNKDLVEAVTEAERANSAKSQFLSRMSHEIRTPMNAIVGLTAIAKNYEHSAEKIDDYLIKIEQSSKVLLNIINDVLDMSAIESAKLKIANAEFDIKNILNSISTIYYSQCKNKGIDYSMRVDISNEIVFGDSLRVNQVLLNLISNAYKFTDKGGKISIDVKEIKQKGKNCFIRFSVSDSGCGMAPEMLKRLFKPFEQESASTAQKHGGSGLGLSIAKNLVDMMHGAINVTSEPGKGTTFIVDLPFEISNHTKMIDPEKLSHMTALIVDDDSTACDYTSLVMGRIGIKFDTASSGKDALRMMNEKREKKERYDICFIDWRMPDMDGIELTHKIREAFDKNTVVIIVSAYDLSEVEDEAKAAGADMFISKPLFQSTVFNTLIQITGGIVKQSSTKPKSYDFSGHRLLLAEDNELNTEIAKELLGLVKMEVDHASNGREAVDLFMEKPDGTYDLILMDIQMPVMDGYEATKIIRSSDKESAKKIPIFAMTANAFTEDISHSISAGMNGHISKPIDTAVLYDTIFRVINKD